MPTEKDVLERQHWWCPKWYWPFAVCSGIRTQHKWCYNFAWVRETRYGFVAHLEGCENGKLYTWTRGALGLGSTTYPAGEMCFDSSLGHDEGRCDSSRTGLQASGLSASDPYASAIDYDVVELNSSTVERGVFEFTGENERLCQKGSWPWNRTLHEQLLTASVITRFAAVQWYVGGIPIPANSGTITPGALCRWPFPLSNGRTQYRALNVKYAVATEANKSTLRLYNDPADGSYSLSIGMKAVDSGREFTSYFTSANFQGETCDFEPEKVAELAKCWRHFSDLSKEKAKSKIPKPGDPVVIFSDEIWKFISEKNRDSVDSLLEIIRNSLQDSPQLFAQAIDQLEKELGLAGISGFISFGVNPEHYTDNVAGLVSNQRTAQRFVIPLIALGIGAVVGILVVRRGGGRR